MINAIRSVFDFRRSSIGLTLGLAVLLLLVPVVSISAQPVEVIDRVFETLIKFPDVSLAQLVDLAAVLDGNEELMVLFLEAPREFLMAEGIDLPPDSLQITGVNFMVLSETEEEPWFGVAEPLEGLVYEPKGVGIFFNNVGIFIQEAFEPVEEGAPGDSTDHKTDMLDFITGRFPGDTFNRIRAVILELDEMAPEDQRRLDFLTNPRQYLVDHNLTLPAASYRIIAIDLNRAAIVGSVVSGEVRAGLGTYQAGIGVFHFNVGIFLQRAI